MSNSSSSLSRPEDLGRDPWWIESDEQKEAARALEMLHAQMVSTVVDPYCWKWVMAVLHHTVQAFATASLSPAERATLPELVRGGSAFQARYDEPDVSAGGGENRRARLVDLAASSLEPGARRELVAEIERLTEYRNGLFREVPRVWALRVNELPRTCRTCLKLVEYLGWNPGRVMWRQKNLLDLARVKFLASIQILDVLESQYSGG